MYDERFKEHLFDRVQQICELYVAGYSFHVLNNAFLIHRGLKRNDDSNAHYTTDKFTWDLFNYHFKDELQRKYKTSRTCSPVENDNQLIGPYQNKLLLDREVNDDFARYQIQRNDMGLPLAIPNEVPVVFEGIIARDPLNGHDHYHKPIVHMGKFFFKFAYVLEKLYFRAGCTSLYS